MRTAIVTGGSRGIGLAVARAILADGGRVTITGLNERRLHEAASSLAAVADADRILALRADVRDAPAVEGMVARTADRFGAFDTLINNAGVGAFAAVADMPPDDWRRIVDTNLTGAYLCSRAAIPHFRKGGGWIVNIASLAGRHPFREGAAYCASKAGLIAFSEALMQEVRFDDIRVSVVLPGSVNTAFGAPSHMTADTQSWKLAPDDVAEAVVDLLRHPARSLPSRVEIRPAKTKPA